MSYIVRVSCGNCGWDGHITIADGELVANQTCPTCGCNTISREFGSSALREPEVEK